MDTPKNPAAVELGRLGGKARADALSSKEKKAIAIKASKAAKKARKKLTPEQRKEAARNAAKARWAKRRAMKI